MPPGALLWSTFPVADTTGAAGIGVTVTAKFGDIVPLPQLLFPATVILPDTAFREKLTVIFLVPAPLAMVAPDGNVHEYAVALVISAHEYATPFVPLHTEEVPVTGPAAFGNGLTKRG